MDNDNKYRDYTNEQLFEKLKEYCLQLNYNITAIDIDDDIDVNFNEERKARQQKMIRMLHDYNEIKDAAQIVLGALANLQGVTIKEMHLKYNLPSQE